LSYKYKCKHILKVLTNEKRGRLAVVSFDRSRFKLFSRKFSNKFVLPRPVRGLKLLREPCFCLLKAIIVSQWRYSVGGLWKNLGNLHATWWIQTNIAIGSLPTCTPISLVMVALFETIYHEVPILTVFSNIGEDVQYRCFN
jgi:hypothetical protein